MKKLRQSPLHPVQELLTEIEYFYQQPFKTSMMMMKKLILALALCEKKFHHFHMLLLSTHNKDDDSERTWTSAMANSKLTQPIIIQSYNNFKRSTDTSNEMV
jgi:hypothetical protein